VQRKLGLAALFLASTLHAQDPLKLLPNAYQLEFENEWVKVVRVHYPAKSRLPEHDHPQLATAYVYLSDSGPIRFKHVATKNWEIARPEVKARSFRLWRAVTETHEVENPNDSASEFLRVEIKTEPLNPRSFTGRFPVLEFPQDENFEKVQFENDQARITRIACAPGKPCLLAAVPDAPALFVALTSLRLRMVAEPSTQLEVNLEAGKTKWMEPGQQESVENVGSTPAEMLRIDFLTKPMVLRVPDATQQAISPLK
jgi:quercetin dioxygenase-like cupin family protein